jgi:hypothetical protein
VASRRWITKRFYGNALPAFSFWFIAGYKLAYFDSVVVVDKQMFNFGEIGLKNQLSTLTGRQLFRPRGWPHYKTLRGLSSVLTASSMPDLTEAE